MKDEAERELVEHEVSIDTYTQLLLRIPKKLSAVELHGIMLKAKKFVDLSEISVNTKQKRESSGQRLKGFWTDDKKKELVESVKKHEASNKPKLNAFNAFAKKYGVSTEKASSYYYNLVGNGHGGK